MTKKVELNDSSCEVMGIAKACIEIEGEGIRAALAELFIAGGEVDLQIKIKCSAECGQIEKITLVGVADAVAKFDND